MLEKDVPLVKEVLKTSKVPDIQNAQLQREMIYMKKINMPLSAKSYHQSNQPTQSQYG